MKQTVTRTVRTTTEGDTFAVTVYATHPGLTPEVEHVAESDNLKQHRALTRAIRAAVANGENAEVAANRVYQQFANA